MKHTDCKLGAIGGDCISEVPNKLNRNGAADKPLRTCFVRRHIRKGKEY